MKTVQKNLGFPIFCFYTSSSKLKPPIMLEDEILQFNFNQVTVDTIKKTLHDVRINLNRAKHWQFMLGSDSSR